MGFFISNELGSYVIKHHFYNLIIKTFLSKMPLQISCILSDILRSRKALVNNSILSTKISYAKKSTH